MRGSTKWITVATLISVGLWTGCEPRQSIETTATAGTPRTGRLHPDVLDRAGLEYYWKFKLKIERGERIERVYRLDELLYCLTNQRRLIAVDARRGLPKWAYTIRQQDETIFAPAHHDLVSLRPKRAGMREMLRPKALPPVEPYRAAFINTLSALTVINRDSGKPVKVIPLTFAANTSGCTDGVNYYLASTEGHYYAVRMDAEVDSWRMSTGEMISVPVRYYDPIVYAGSQDKTLCAAEGAKHRKLTWRREFHGEIVAPFHVDRRGVFIGTLDGRIHIIDRLTGDRGKVPDPETRAFKDWGPFMTRGEIRDAIQVGAVSIFQRVRKDTFYAISIESAGRRWTRKHGRVVLAVLGGEVCLLDKDRRMMIIDEVSGKVNTSMPMTGWDLFVPNAQLSAIYAADHEGMLCCIRRKGAPALTDQMLNPALREEDKE